MAENINVVPESVHVQEIKTDEITLNNYLMPEKRKARKHKPNLITTEQRMSNNKIKMLRSENLELRERIAFIENLLKSHTNTTSEDLTLFSNNKFKPLMYLNMDEDEESTSHTTNDVTTPVTDFTVVKQAIKRKNDTKSLQRATKSFKVTEQQNVNRNDNDNPSKETITKKRAGKPPPLHIHNQTIKDTIDLMKGAQLHKFEVKRVTTDKHSIMVSSMDDYIKANNILKEVNTQYFTYTPKELKPKTLVLRGLTEEEDIVGIKAEVEEINVNIKIIKIMQMNRKRPNENLNKLPLYLVQFEPDTNMADILKIKTINYQRVTWEHLKNKNEIMQCRNCQRFGHAASNCNLLYRCVKCHISHMPRECTITGDIERDDIFCVNCQKTGHPASFKGCPIYQQMLEKLKIKIKESKMNSTRAFKSTFVNEESGSYAKVVSQNTNEDELSVTKLARKIEIMSQTIKQQSEQIAQLLQIIKSL